MFLQASILGILSLLILNTGCNQHDVASVGPGKSGEQTQDLRINLGSDLDILFVIDNASTMASQQIALAESFPSLLQELERLGAERPNLHLGVISSDLGAGPYNIAQCQANGDEAKLQRGTECINSGDRYLIDVRSDDGERRRNYEGNLAEAFSCIAELGTTGCRFGQPLEAMFRALNSSNGEWNAGFLRPDANLAIIIVTDKDDCSTEDLSLFDSDSQLDRADSELGFFSEFRCFEFGVSCNPDSPRVPGLRQDCEPRESSDYMHDVGKYTHFLQSLKDDPAKITLAAIRGPASEVAVSSDNQSHPALAPSCCAAGQTCGPESSGNAAPAVRLDALLKDFPGRTTSGSICSDSWDSQLTDIARKAGDSLSNPCIEGDLLLFAGQPTCTVTEVAKLEQNTVETLIPECDAGSLNLPCYHFDLDTERCPNTPTQLALRIERGTAPAPISASLALRCEVNTGS